MDVKVAKAEKSYCMVHGQKPKHSFKSNNQQLSPDEGKVQRLFRKEVDGKLLTIEAVRSSILEDEDIVSSYM